jgi:hypothetical protein
MTGLKVIQKYTTCIKSSFTPKKIFIVFSQILTGIFFLITTASRPALEPTQPPIMWVSGALSLTTDLNLVLRLIMHRPTLPLPHMSSYHDV